MCKKRKKRRNKGRGKQMGYAFKNILKRYYGGGRYKTIASHMKRVRVVIYALKDMGIKCIEDVNRETADWFASMVRNAVEDGRYAISYARNILSTWNVMFRAALKSESLYIKPAKYIPKGSTIAQDVPACLDKELLRPITDNIEGMGRKDVSVLAQVIREFGLRQKEGILFDAKQALREALKKGEINIIKGTKGGRGRSVDRWVKIDDAGIELLREAVIIQGDQHSFIPLDLNYVKYLNQVNYIWSRAKALVGHKMKFRDLRQARFCEIYREETGCDAPVIHGCRSAEKSVDMEARQRISYEAGHNRTSVAGSYVGGMA